jgi:hypothetical protein
LLIESLYNLLPFSRTVIAIPNPEPTIKPFQDGSVHVVRRDFRRLLIPAFFRDDKKSAQVKMLTALVKTVASFNILGPGSADLELVHIAMALKGDFDAKVGWTFDTLVEVAKKMGFVKEKSTSDGIHWLEITRCVCCPSLSSLPVADSPTSPSACAEGLDAVMVRHVRKLSLSHLYIGVAMSVKIGAWRRWPTSCDVR